MQLIFISNPSWFLAKLAVLDSLPSLLTQFFRGILANISKLENKHVLLFSFFLFCVIYCICNLNRGIGYGVKILTLQSFFTRGKDPQRHLYMWMSTPHSLWRSRPSWAVREGVGCRFGRFLNKLRVSHTCRHQGHYIFNWILWFPIQIDGEGSWWDERPFICGKLKCAVYVPKHLVRVAADSWFEPECAPSWDLLFHTITHVMRLGELVAHVGSLATVWLEFFRSKRIPLFRLGICLGYVPVTDGAGSYCVLAQCQRDW